MSRRFPARDEYQRYLSHQEEYSAVWGREMIWWKLVSAQSHPVYSEGADPGEYVWEPVLVNSMWTEVAEGDISRIEGHSVTDYLRAIFASEHLYRRGVAGEGWPKSRTQDRLEVGGQVFRIDSIKLGGKRQEQDLQVTVLGPEILEDEQVQHTDFWEPYSDVYDEA